MVKIANIKSVLLGLLLLVPIATGFPCSMYKITVNGKTMVGCNEDAWRTTPHIWFETADKSRQYGAAFTGSRWDGGNGYAPQSGMNEMGLVYSRLAASAPEIEPIDPKLKPIANPTQYLKDILHSCKNVDEVRAFISRYDHSFFIEDVMIYIEKSGRYLIVEPYALTIGKDANYVLSNFCPSVTAESDARKLDRYRHGVDFLKRKSDFSLGFATALSDTMHVCRERIGDGTLLTSIWNAEEGNVNLYFYHQYKNTVRFNLKAELAKGDHLVALEPLFPANPEFEKLRDYKTPLNSAWMRLFLLFSGMLFFFSACFFLVVYLRKRAKLRYKYALIALFPVGLVLCFYMYVLLRNPGIFYFPAPYQDPHNQLVTIISYLPYALPLLLLLMIGLCIKIIRERAWSVIASGLFVLHNLVLLTLSVLLGYWGFFQIG